MPAAANSPAKPADATSQPAANAPAEPQKKKGFFGRVFGGKGGDKNQKNTGTNSSPDKGNQPPPN